VDCAANQSDKFDRFPPPMSDVNSNRPGMQAGKQQQPNPVEVLAGLVDSMTPDRMIEILSYLKGIASRSTFFVLSRSLVTFCAVSCHRSVKLKKYTHPVAAFQAREPWKRGIPRGRLPH
jgi:hypothetical protein